MSATFVNNFLLQTFGESYTVISMPNWLSTPDGRLLNFQGAKNVVQVGSTLIITQADGSTDSINYADPSSAATGLTNMLASLQLGDTGSGTQALISVSSVTPSTVAHGSVQNVVLVGSGFALDISTALFHGEVVIGTDTLTGLGGNITYVNNNTLLLTWTPAAAGTFDVVYTRAGSTIPYTITNGITIT